MNWKIFFLFIFGVIVGSFILVGIIVKTSHADQYQDLSREFNQIYTEQLRVRIQHLPKKAFVEVSLKDGSVVKGTFEGFVKYDDSIWVLPQGKLGLFAAEAYSIRDVQNVLFIINHPI